MDYVTEQFNAQRVPPSRKLRLPLNAVQQNTDRLTPPKIKNGIIYKIKPRVSVNAYQEDNLSLTKTNEKKPFIIGVFGFTDNEMLVETKEKAVEKVNLRSLDIVGELDLGIIQSSQAFFCKNFFIVEYQDERTYGEPIKLGRKNINENKLAWGFEPVHTIKSFSVTDDERKVIVGDYRGGISTLDIETGKVLWQKDVDTIKVLTEKEIEEKNKYGAGKISDNLHIYKDIIVMGYLFNYIIGLDVATGSVKWKRKFDDSNVGKLAADDKGRVYFLDAWHKRNPAILYTVDCLTGESIKELMLDHDEVSVNENFSSATYSDVTSTHFWGVTSPGFLYAINLETGKIDWTYNLGNGLPHVPMFICNNRLYVQTLTEQFIFEGQGGYIPD